MKACELQRPKRRMLLFPRIVTLTLHTPKQTTVEANSTLDGVACNQIITLVLRISFTDSKATIVNKSLGKVDQIPLRAFSIPPFAMLGQC